MGKQYALNIAVTAEELKDKPSKVIRNRSGPPAVLRKTRVTK